MKRIMALVLSLIFIFSLAACSIDKLAANDPVSSSLSTNELGDGSETTETQQQNEESESHAISMEYDRDDLDASISDSDMSFVKLEGNSITIDGSGATVNGNILTITSAGVYSISGVLDEGQILVNSEDEETVKLILNGMDITCSTSAPIYISNAEKTVITLADGTENSVSDGATYIFENAETDEPNAAIFSDDDLTINGSGSLTVNANYNNGIASKDDLVITGGTITINAINDGIKGRDSIVVKDGIITINAGGDGMQSTNSEDVDKGYIYIEGGTLNITAGTDGIQAETLLKIDGGDFTISSGGGSINSSNTDQWGDWGKGRNPNDSDSTPSAKGLKAGVDVTITGGTIDIDSSDDSIHSNDSLTISGGDITLKSGDDGIHSDATLEISGGELRITNSYEGIESASITINAGTIHIVSSDDGINAAGGNDGSSVNGRQGQNNFNFSGDNHLYINGGYIVIDAGGDGLDINGSIDMTGGHVIINGPTSNNNGPLDYLGSFDISGGFLVAAGSAGMAQAPSASSSQYSVILAFSSAIRAGIMVHIESEDGGEVLSFEPTKVFQSVVLCSPELEDGSTYTIYLGGSSTGTVTDGLYSDGIYADGTEIADFTISDIVTGVGYYGGGVFGGHGGGGGPGNRQP
jgi:hypothetical protein